MKLTRRQWLGWGAASAAALGVAACRPMQPNWRTWLAPHAPAWPQLKLNLLGSHIIPHGTALNDWPVGGLSGLDYDAQTGDFYAISDDRAKRGPLRLLRFRWPIEGRRLGPLELLEHIPINDPQGQPYPRLGQHSAARPHVPDAEALRFDPASRSLWWASEGDARHAMPPLLRQVNLRGQHLQDLPLPPMLREVQRPGHGPRNNLGPEGVALSPDGSLWLAMEGSLQQDGNPGEKPAPVRISQLQPSSGQLMAQYAYQPDPYGSQGMFGENGVSDILSLDARYLLVLERGFSLISGLRLKLFLADTQGGSTVQNLPSLKDAAYTPMPKRLIQDFWHSELRPLDNMEALCWGPRLPNGRRSLITLTDNNFNRLQKTQIAAFELIEESA